MAGPGGKEVGRVSVRVVPDTDGFREKVKAELEKLKDFEIKIKPDLTGFKERIKAELASIKDATVNVRVDVDRSALSKPIVPPGKKVTLPVELDIQQGAKNEFLQRVRKVVGDVDMRAKIGVDLDDRGVGSRIQSLLARVRAGLNRAGPEVASFIGGFLDGLGRIGASLRRVVIPGLLLVAAITPLLAIAGAGISVAWGAVATAIAAIPSLLFLAVTAGGAVALGLDGIKAAAKRLQPEFENLKKSVSNTFEKGLIPVFDKIKKSDFFKVVTAGMNGVARQLVNVADKITAVVISGAGLAYLNKIFEHSAQSLEDMAPGLASILSTTLKVGSLPGAWKALTFAITEFGTAYEKSVTSLIGKGAMQRAFQGLETVLGSLARGFVELVDNGIEMFAGAAPGTTKFLDSMNKFFSRFDWERLGRAVGSVFQGLGETLDGMSDQDIEDITLAFEKLGDLFLDKGFQQSLRDIVRSFDDLIDIMRTVSATVVPIAGYLAKALSFPGVAEAVGVGIVAAIVLFFAGLAARLTRGIARIAKIAGRFVWSKLFRPGNIPNVAGEIGDKLDDLDDKLDKKRKKGGLKGALLGPDGCKSTRRCLDEINDKLGKIGRQTDDLRNNGGLKRGLLGPDGCVSSRATLDELSNKVNTVNNSVTNLKNTGGLKNALLGAGDVALTAASLGQLQTGIAGVSAAAFTAVPTLTAFNAGLQSIGTSTSVTTAATTMSTALTGMRTQLGATNVAMAGSTAASSAWAASVGAAASSLGAKFTVLPGIIGGALASIPGIVGSTFGASTSVAGAQSSAMVSVVRGNVAQLPGVVGTAAGAATASARSGLAPMPAIGQQAGTGHVQGVRSGLSALPGTVISLVNQAVAGVRSTLGGWVSAGTSLAAGLARGIKSGASAAISAASDIARRALAAAKSILQINSPSKAFAYLGEMSKLGFINEFKSGAAEAAAASRAMAQSAVDGANKVSAMDPLDMSLASSVTGSYDHNINSPEFGAVIEVTAVTNLDGKVLTRSVNKVNHMNGRQ